MYKYKLISRPNFIYHVRRYTNKAMELEAFIVSCSNNSTQFMFHDGDFMLHQFMLYTSDVNARKLSEIRFRTPLEVTRPFFYNFAGYGSQVVVEYVRPF